MGDEAVAIEGLDPVGCRVLGSLIEKERATPQNYPLTLNALRLACNQSTNRDPVVDYDDHTVEAALGWLREHRIIRIVYSQSNRAAKYRHVLDELLQLADDELAVLCVLLLRGPQTAGEIKGRTERLFAFADLAAVNQTLENLMTREAGALVVRLERQPGQKDARYLQLVGDAGVPSAPAYPTSPAGPAPTAAFSAAPVEAAPVEPVAAPTVPGDGVHPALVERVAELEAQVAQLRSEFDALRSEFE
jgi:uncharacterized protein YceH (UPF0502 family)